MRNRTTFYIALGRLLMVDLGEDEDKFESFMAPITSKSLLSSFPLYNVMSALISVLMVSIKWPVYFDIYSTLKFVGFTSRRHGLCSKSISGCWQ